MKKRIGILVMILILCIGVLPMAASADDTLTYIALGDSITSGYGLSSADYGFVAKLASTIQTEESITVNYTNKGESGQTTAGLASSLSSMNLADAELITITIGGNDLMAAFYDVLAGLLSTDAETVQLWLSDTVEYSSEVTQIAMLFFDNTAVSTITTTMATASSACVTSIASIISSIRSVNDTAIVLLANQYNPYTSFSGTLYAAVNTLFDTVISDFNSKLANNATITSGCAIVNVYGASVSTNATTNPLNLDFHPDASGHSTIAGLMYTAYTNGCIHSWNEGTVTTEATCTEDGVMTYTCTNNCGTTKTEVIPATGHSYDAGVVSIAATCTENGAMTYTCGNCGDTYTEVIPTTGHDYDANGFCTACGQYQPAVWDDDNGWYEISNAGQLFWFAALVNGDSTHAEFTAQNTSADAILTTNISIPDGYNWTPIGSSASPYSGTFDGQNHTISGLRVNSSSDDQGLFGTVSGTVQNVTVEGSITGGSYVGGIVGYNIGTISGCTNYCTVSGTSYVGGIAGYSTGEISGCNNFDTITGSRTDGYVGGIAGYSTGEMTGCTNSGSVSGAKYVGGITGYSSGEITSCTNENAITGTSANGDKVGGIVGNNHGTITSCSNSGSISGSAPYTGGIAGNNYETVTYCSNSGSVSGTSRVGGIVGSGGSNSVVKYCFNTASVSGTSAVGGVVGRTELTTITSCYSTGSVSGGDELGGIVGYNGDYSTVDDCCTTYSSVVGGSDENTAVTNTVTLTTDQFASGAASYVLNGNSSTSPIWYQTIGTDALPVWDNTHGTVYAGTTCAGDAVYSNEDITGTTVHFYDSNGFCENDTCGQYEPAVLNAGSQYEISNAGQLFWFAALVNGDSTHAEFTDQDKSANAVLTANISIPNGYEWTPIGNYASDASLIYSGVFSGDSWNISGLYINTTGDYQGLFGYVSGEVQALSGVTGSITGGNYVGSIAGYNAGEIKQCPCSVTISGGSYVGGIAGYSTGEITNCSNSSEISGTGDYVGGIAGYSTGDISDSTNGGSVSGSDQHVGGIAGQSSGTITSCTNSGAVTGSGQSVGGIAGENNGNVTYCTNSGAVSGDTYVGGIVGQNYEGTVEICFNTAAVSSGGNYVGGVAGRVFRGTIKSCYSTGTISGDSEVGGVVGWNIESTVENCCTTYSITIYTNEGSTTVTNTVTLTTGEFASGKAAYVLNGNVSGGTSWYQNLDNGSTVDAYPVWDNTHGAVYYGTDCAGTAIYSNTTVPPAEHDYVATVTAPTCTKDGYPSAATSIRTMRSKPTATPPPKR